MEVIKRITKEYQENDVAVRISVVTFLGIPIFKTIDTTTNHNVVAQLSIKKYQNRIKIKGFNENETED